MTLPDSTTIEYVIDGQNRRIGKKVNGTLVQGFLYQDQLNPVAELDGAGNVIKRFVYGSKPNVPDYFVAYDEFGTETGTYRVISDHLGSVRLVVDVASGVVAQRIDYDSFGNATLVNGTWDVQPFGFAGGLFDADTGLVRFGARDYDSVVGRWTAKDPIGFAATEVNLYKYSLLDPVNTADQTGLDGDLGSQMTAVDMSSNLKRIQVRSVAKELNYTKRALCSGRGHMHHGLPQFAGIATKPSIGMNGVMHLSLYHPLLNVLLKSFSLPGSYAASGSALWQILLATSSPAKNALAASLIASAMWVDGFCASVPGYQPITDDVIQEVSKLYTL